jgi:hypothetical protein
MSARNACHPSSWHNIDTSLVDWDSELVRDSYSIRFVFASKASTYTPVAQHLRDHATKTDASACLTRPAPEVWTHRPAMQLTL